MKRILLIFGLALALALPVAALAGSPFVTGDTIIVAEEDIIDGNYLVSGNSINIDGNVNGDVIFAGSNVVINGDVAGDVIGAGASIRITGEVEGSVRVAGSNIQIDGQVGHNVIAFGGNVVISDSAEIGWELFTGAGNVEVRGEIGTNVTGAAGNMLISGSVGRDLNVAGDTISILPDASIDGDVTYRTENAESLIVSEGATISGEITHDTLDKHFDGNKIRGYLTSAYVFGQVVALFGMFILGLAFINLVPKHVVKVKEELVKRPWSNILVGLGVAVLTPIVVVLLLITLIGAQLALLILTSYLILLFWLARVYAGIAIGMLLMKNSKSEGAKGLVWPMVLGLAVYVILGSIPIIGWVAKFLVVLWGIGGLVRVEKSILADWR